MSAQTNKYITPILDTVIDKAIAHVQDGLFSGDAVTTWRCLQKLVYATGDIRVIDEMEPSITEIENTVRRMSRRRGLTVSDSFNKQKQIKDYLESSNLQLFKKVMLILEQHNYLQRRSREVPTNVAPALFEKQVL